MEKVKKIVINNEIYEIGCSQKHLNGYLYDSLIYRYIRAREHMAEWEWGKGIIINMTEIGILNLLKEI